MYIIKINMPTKSVYLKEDFGLFYLYTHNISEAKQWLNKETAEIERKKLTISTLEKTEVSDINNILETKYFVNPFSIKIEEIKTNLKYPNLYDTLEEALIHIDIIRDNRDDYENLSFNSDSDNDGSSGRKEEEV